ncbi:MAG: YihY/virulence factor BrkB family protein [Deltaproteobacteria bacterium]|nr:YihY/virulence factor BrkB family protein [Deltaproteobacteria bacterium]
MPQGVSWKRFAKDLKGEISDDNVSNGAAALAYYLMLSVFPAAIFLLSLLPYLPIPNVDTALMDLLRQALPGEAASLFTGVVQQVTSQRRGGLLSVGLLLTLWAASNGLYAIMQQLNITYDVKEGRPFWKTRGLALMLTLLFFILVVGAFALVVFGGVVQSWAEASLGASSALLFGFAALRWVIIALALLLGFALIYYLGPDVEQRFRFVSPGSVVGVLLLAGASVVFRLYVANFGKYSATYGSLGAVIILLLWLYIAGWVLLLGSEINALVEHYRPEGKVKGQKREEHALPAPGDGGGAGMNGARGGGQPPSPPPPARPPPEPPSRRH